MQSGASQAGETDRNHSPPAAKNANATMYSAPHPSRRSGTGPNSQRCEEAGVAAAMRGLSHSTTAAGQAASLSSARNVSPAPSGPKGWKVSTSAGISKKSATRAITMVVASRTPYCAWLARVENTYWGPYLEKKFEANLASEPVKYSRALMWLEKSWRNLSDIPAYREKVLLLLDRLKMKAEANRVTLDLSAFDTA